MKPADLRQQLHRSLDAWLDKLESAADSAAGFDIMGRSLLFEVLADAEFDDENRLYLHVNVTEKQATEAEGTLERTA